MQRPNGVFSEKEIARVAAQPAMLHDQVKKKTSPNNTSKKIARILFSTVRDFAILRLLYATGIKLKELCRLQLWDLDFREHRVKIRGRNGIRYVPISPSLEIALTRWLTTRNQSKVQNAALFITFPTNNPIGPREIQRRIKAYAENARIEKNISPRNIRRSVAYHLLKKDRATYATCQSIADLLGISLPSIERYLPEVSFSDLNKVFQSIHIPNW